MPGERCPTGSRCEASEAGRWGRGAVSVAPKVEEGSGVFTGFDGDAAPVFVAVSIHQAEPVGSRRQGDTTDGRGAEVAVSEVHLGPGAHRQDGFQRAHFFLREETFSF